MRMPNINGIAVRLGGHTILDRASASLPPKSRVAKMHVSYFTQYQVEELDGYATRYDKEPHAPSIRRDHGGSWRRGWVGRLRRG